MTTTSLPRFLRGLSLWLLAALAPLGLGAQSLCPLQNETLSGTYLSHATGFVDGNPLAVVAITVYDGRGNFQLSGTVSANGVIFQGGSGTGTYTVNPDCTGTQTFGPGAAHYNFVVTPDGQRVTYIQTDSGAVVTVTSVRLARRPGN